MAKYVITYTSDVSHELDDDFTLIEIHAHSQKDADLIISNIECIFKGVTIECIEEVVAKRPRRKENSDRRKK